MRRASNGSSWRPDRACGVGFVLARSSESAGAVLRDNGAASPTPHFFALKEGQPSGWPSRASRTVGRGSHPKGRSGAEDPRSGLTAAVDRARGGHAPSDSEGLAKWWGVLFWLPFPPLQCISARMLSVPFVRFQECTRGRAKSSAAWAAGQRSYVRGRRLVLPASLPSRWSKAPQRQHRRKLPDETQAVRRDDKTHSQFHPEASTTTLPKQHIHRHVPLPFQFRAYHSRRSVHNTPSHFRVPRASEAHTNIDLHLTDEPPQPEHGFDVSRVFKVAAPHKVHACRNACPSVDPTCSADRECRRRVKERRAALHLRTRSRIGVSA